MLTVFHSAAAVKGMLVEASTDTAPGNFVAVTAPVELPDTAGSRQQHQHKVCARAASDGDDGAPPSASHLPCCCWLRWQLKSAGLVAAQHLRLTILSGYNDFVGVFQVDAQGTS